MFAISIGTGIVLAVVIILLAVAGFAVYTAWVAKRQFNTSIKTVRKIRDTANNFYEQEQG